MEIQIKPRREVASLLRQNHHEPPANFNIISIRNQKPKQNKLHKDCENVLNLQFDDVLANDDCCMTNDDAMLIAAFVHTTCANNKNLIIHCQGGVSRSAGVAAAIAHCLQEKGVDVSPTSEEIWTNPKYFPNEHCFSLVCNAFNCPVPEEQIKTLIKRNIEAWCQLDI